MKKKLLISSILSIIMCLSVMAGATFALFTSESAVNIAVTSGKVNVVATIDESSVQTKKDGANYAEGANNMFGGVAEFDSSGLILNGIVAGDGVKFNIIVKNQSNITIKYRTIISCQNDTGLFKGLNVNVGDKQGYNGITFVDKWEELTVGSADAVIPVSIELPSTAGNEYQDKTCTITYKVEAIQGNADVEDPEDDVIYIYTANDLMTLSGKYLVSNNGANETANVELMKDINANGAEFKEIGVAYGDTLNFEGNGHTISNIKLGTGEHNGMTNVGMFYVDAGATLNVKNLKFNSPVVVDGVDEYTTGAAVVVGYANGEVNLIDVDVDNASVNNTLGNAAIHVGYCVNKVNLVGCDIIGSATFVSGEFEDGAVRKDKTGAFVGTANTAGCVVVAENCTNESNYRDWGRVINGATWNGFIPVSTTAELLSAIKSAPTDKETQIVLTEKTYDGDIAITLADLKKQGGDVVIKAYEGAKDIPTITGTVTLGYRNQGVGSTMYNANVTFKGITFDHAQNGKHSIDVQDVKSLTLDDCTIIGDGEYGITSARGNATGTSIIKDCTFQNAGIQLLGNFATGLVITGCTFEESRVNVQAGNGVTVEGCTFANTITSANVGDSFYCIRSNSTAITVKNCQIEIDSKLIEVASSQAKWYVLCNRGTTNWTVENVKVTLTESAKKQTELSITECTSTGVINATNLEVVVK